MAAIDYIDPKGYWCDPSGNIRRMGDEYGEQEIIAHHDGNLLGRRTDASRESRARF